MVTCNSQRLLSCNKISLSDSFCITNESYSWLLIVDVVIDLCDDTGDDDTEDDDIENDDIEGLSTIKTDALTGG